MESNTENNAPDKRKTQKKKSSHWEAMKLLKAFRKSHNITHSYMPLIVVILICAVAGSIAIVILPGREQSARKHWSGIYRVSDEMVGFHLRNEFDISDEFEVATGIAHVGDHGILVCGGTANAEKCKIVRYSTDGQILVRIPLSALPSDILVADDNPFFADKILVAYRYGVWVYDWDGKQIQVISAPVSMSPNREPFISSIAVHDDILYMADAMQNVVYRFNAKGECDFVIGKNMSYDEKGGFFSGFDADLPYFDLTVDSTGVLWVGDTKNRRLVPFDRNGRWLSAKTWGKGDYSTESLLTDNSVSLASHEFFGNNPASIAVLNDGRFVTAERIVNQVKVFSATGDFITYVAVPDFFGDESDLIRWADKELQRKSQGDFWIPTLRVDAFANDTVLLLDQIHLKVYLFVQN